MDSNLGACFKPEKDVLSDESGQRCSASEDDKQQVYLAQVANSEYCFHISNVLYRVSTR